MDSDEGGDRAGMGGVLFVQPALPNYRVDFFRRMHDALGNDLQLVISSNGETASIDFDATDTSWITTVPPVRTILKGVYWQPELNKVAVGDALIIVLSGNARFLSTLFLAVRGKLHGCRLVWWSHYRSYSGNKLSQRFRLFISRFFDHQVFYTQREVINFHRDYPRLARSSKTSWLGNGLNAEEIGNYRERYEPHKRLNRLAFVGRVTPKSNFALMIKAMILSNEKYELDVIGASLADIDGESRDLVTKTQLRQRIRWHGPLTEEADIARVMNKCMLFVYPGDVGLSLIHGMTYGLPAILHDDDSSHMPEIAAFLERDSGFRFESDCEISLNKTIEFALANPSLLEKISDDAVAVVEAGYNTNVMSKNFLRILEQVRQQEEA
ncbi:MAG: glycosyltransferase [Pseudomonadota bacterium]